jgi:hypothetical protein
MSLERRTPWLPIGKSINYRTNYARNAEVALLKTGQAGDFAVI